MNKIKYSEERDTETGFSYFGARYYDLDLSAVWLSVDPMADKYPGMRLKIQKAVFYLGNLGMKPLQITML